MSDLIDRQEAIDAINALEYPSSLVDVKRVIVELPSAQFATDINVGDTISRQMTIDTVLAKLTERERKNLRHMWTTVEVKYFISKMLEQLPSAQPHWIPCSERLPEDQIDVLVTRHFHSDSALQRDNITESYYVEVASYNYGEWISYSDEYKIKPRLHEVVAWMPLPEPYGGDGK